MTAIVRYTPTHTLALFVLVLLLFADSATAQLLSVSTVRISVAPRATDGTSNTIATLGQASDGTVSLIVRSFDRRTGFQQGTPFIGLLLPAVEKLKFTDVLVSTVFEPGAVLALDSDRRVHVYPLDFMPDGTPFLAAPTRIIGPLGPPEAGEGTVLGEVPNVRDPANPFLAIGTRNGGEVRLLPYLEQDNVAMGDGSVRFTTGPIQDLGPIAQVGYFALGVISNGTLFLINPDGDINKPGLQPMVTASLRDPRRIPLIDFGSPLLTRDSAPFIDPLSDLIFTANGTAEIATLEIPPDPQLGDTLRLFATNPSNDKVIVQVVLASLTFLPHDGLSWLHARGSCHDCHSHRQPRPGFGPRSRQLTNWHAGLDPSAGGAPRERSSGVATPSLHPGRDSRCCACELVHEGQVALGPPG